MKGGGRGAGYDLSSSSSFPSFPSSSFPSSSSFLSSSPSQPAPPQSLPPSTTSKAKSTPARVRRIIYEIAKDVYAGYKPPAIEAAVAVIRRGGAAKVIQRNFIRGTSEGATGGGCSGCSGCSWRTGGGWRRRRSRLRRGGWRQGAGREEFGTPSSAAGGPELPRRSPRPSGGTRK